VAIKLLRPTMRQDRNSQGQARLLREAQTMARLSHPNVVQVYEVGEVDDAVFLAMELVVAGKDPARRGWR
jgi:serine/threonine protein kinase